MTQTNCSLSHFEVTAFANVWLHIARESSLVYDPTKTKMGFCSALAFANASGPQGIQSTGLSALDLRNFEASPRRRSAHLAAGMQAESTPLRRAVTRLF